MNALRKLATGFLGKTAIASTVLGGFLMFFGAATASARPVVVGYAGPHVRVVVVPRAYYGPRVVYYRHYVPAYRVYRRPVAYRYWDARFHCWRYR